MKNIISSKLIIFTLILGITFAACKKNDSIPTEPNDTTKVKTRTEMLLGTWRLDSTKGNGDMQRNNKDSTILLYFGKNDTLIVTAPNLPVNLITWKFQNNDSIIKIVVPNSDVLMYIVEFTDKNLHWKYRTSPTAVLFNEYYTKIN